MTSTNTPDREQISIDVTVYWELTVREQLIREGQAERLLEHALRQEEQTGSWELAIRFVDDAKMSRLHERFMDDPSPTDILTFPYDQDDDVSGGDIVISVDTAARNAADADWLVSDELRFLMLHGMLHILGWDDQADAERAAMLARQHTLLEGWMASGPT